MREWEGGRKVYDAETFDGVHFLGGGLGQRGSDSGCHINLVISRYRAASLSRVIDLCHSMPEAIQKLSA